MTYGELIIAADRLADDLARHGVRSGQRVLLWLPTRIESVLALLACSRNGYVWCPSPHRNHTVAEIVDLIERTRAQPSFTSSDMGPTPAAKASKTKSKFAFATSRAPARSARRAAGNENVRRRGADRGRAAEHRPKLRHLPGLHLGIDRETQRRHAQRQHAARGTARHCRRLASRFGLDVYSMSPLSHNLGVGDAAYVVRRRRRVRRPRPT